MNRPTFSVPDNQSTGETKISKPKRVRSPRVWINEYNKIFPPTKTEVFYCTVRFYDYQVFLNQIKECCSSVRKVEILSVDFANCSAYIKEIKKLTP